MLGKKQKEEILAQAMTVEEGQQLQWDRTKRTPKGFMKPANRRGTYLHITTRGGMFGRGRSDGQYEPNRGKRQGVHPGRTVQQSRSSTRAGRARADREAKLAARDA